MNCVQSNGGSASDLDGLGENNAALPTQIPLTPVVEKDNKGGFELPNRLSVFQELQHFQNVFGTVNAYLKHLHLKPTPHSSTMDWVRILKPHANDSSSSCEDICSSSSFFITGILQDICLNSNLLSTPCGALLPLQIL